MSPIGHASNAASPNTTYQSTLSSQCEPVNVNLPSSQKPSNSFGSIGNTSDTSRLTTAAKPDTSSLHHEPITIDQMFSQKTFSTFGVTSSSPAGKPDDNCSDVAEHKDIERTDSVYMDGLEDSHSSFSTFSVPANRYL